MREHETNATLESAPYSASSRDAVPDSSFSKDTAYLAHDGTGSVRDNSRLADLGYTPELKRDFSALETFGVAFSIMCVLSVPTTEEREDSSSQGCDSVYCVHYHL